MNTKIRISLAPFLVSVLFTALIFLGGCNSKNNNQNEVKIGVITPLTGELATYGVACKKGVDLASEEVNKEKMLNGKTLVVEYADSKGEPTTAINALQKFVNVDGIKFFIGDISSNVTMSLIPVIDRNNVFLFSPGAATPKLTDSSPYFARNWPSNNEEANSAAEYAYNVLKYKTATIVYVNNDWGIGLEQNFEKKFASMGGKILSAEIYPYGNTDFRTLIVKIRSVHPPLVYLAGNQKEMGHFMRQFREVDKKTFVISNTSFLESDCLNIAGETANGVVVPTPEYSPQDSTNKTAYQFYKAYEDKYGSAPSLVDANGYDAVMLIVKGYNKFENDPLKVSQYIRNLKDFSGAGGTLSFTNGDVSVKNVFKKVENGQAVIIK